MSPHIIALGEILWDVFPDGPRFGGAPANFACSAAELAHQSAWVSIVSAVGQDPLGQQAVDALTTHGVNTASVQRVHQPTGTVDVSIDDLGIASYRFAENTAWDNVDWHHDYYSLTDHCSAVCFGTLGQRSPMSQNTIQQFLNNLPAATLRVLDLNLRPPYYDDDVIQSSLELATVLKLNEEELDVLSRLLGLFGDPTDKMQQLADRFDLQAIAVTRGADGAILMADDSVSDLPGLSAQVIDTVGAGDAYTAAMLLGLLAEQDLATVNQKAISAASYVCSRPGGTMAFPAHLHQPVAVTSR